MLDLLGNHSQIVATLIGSKMQERNMEVFTYLHTKINNIVACGQSVKWKNEPLFSILTTKLPQLLHLS